MSTLQFFQKVNIWGTSKRDKISDRKLGERAFTRGELKMWPCHSFSKNLGKLLNKRMVHTWVEAFFKVTGVYDKRQNSLAFCFIVMLQDYNLRTIVGKNFFTNLIFLERCILQNIDFAELTFARTTTFCRG